MFKSYKATAVSVFNEDVQRGIVLLNKKAETAGVKLEEQDVQYTIVEVNNDWVIILLVFDLHLDFPKEFTITITKKDKM